MFEKEAEAEVSIFSFLKVFLILYPNKSKKLETHQKLFLVPNMAGDLVVSEKLQKET